MRLNQTLEFIGYYRIKKNLKHHLFCRKLQKEDTQKKIEIQRAIYSLQESQLTKKGDESDIIVSLTSYGVRINDTLPYTLYSLLQQTRKPNRIVVWIDNINWSKDSLPPILKKLEDLGVEFYFVKDTRSYKKLIPALEMFPDNVIITVDDDWYYNHKTVEWLLSDYLYSDKRTVYGTWGYRPGISIGEFTPYSTWSIENELSREDVSLIGCGGILYPPRIFDEEISKVDLFREMAPYADDLWFWAMERRLGIKSKLSTNNGYGLHTAVNRIDVYEPNQPGSLFFINEVNGKNDIQFKRLVEFYGLKP